MNCNSDSLTVNHYTCLCSVSDSVKVELELTVRTDLFCGVKIAVETVVVCSVDLIIDGEAVVVM